MRCAVVGDLFQRIVLREAFEHNQSPNGYRERFLGSPRREFRENARVNNL
jgi:hypothetical protein